jgi:hypothetical protein
VARHGGDPKAAHLRQVMVSKLPDCALLSKKSPCTNQVRLSVDSRARAARRVAPGVAARRASTAAAAARL